ncbi:divalent metal cation transporter [Paraburkholderia guartelaensis]|jgi:Mn2+/Fe2+ NRAMP family transporter|uniref:Divalent metal cation transporter n=1 Tax=Paraburkholderia guartelaensis TaxID=2546446 RepID=A0A4R5LD04_9BURK|nr:divalent metal cation transporter [Paraburkholderia guartelaensis]TDG06962.1 divalent metal cation transporter [Paraburkholderia guartelaensis]
MTRLSTLKQTVTRALRRLALWGPGLLVMLADCDAGNVVTAAQAGAQTGLRLLPVLLALVPLLYMIQELTVRLGIFTGRGYGELIRSRFGPVWAALAAAGLVVAVLGSLVTEFTGVAGVGEMYGVSRAVTLPLAVILLTGIVLTGSHKRVDRIAIAIGAFDLTFFAVAWSARHKLQVMVPQMTHLGGGREAGYLAAALIGATFNPWMVFYQQAAVADSLTAKDFTSARVETAVGAVLTQLLTAAVLVAAAATLSSHGEPRSLDSIGEISNALVAVTGPFAGRLLFGAGVLGAALVAAIVSSLALAWGLGDVFGYRASLEVRPGQAPWFYGAYVLAVAGSAWAVWLAPDLVSLNVAAQVVNTLMLPLVLGLLVALSVTALPQRYRPRGLYLWLVVFMGAVVCAGGAWGAVQGLRPLPAIPGLQIL